jgi:hypothetical protein
MAMTIWMFFLILPRYCWNMFILVTGIYFSMQACLPTLNMGSKSSVLYKLGTSPPFKMLLMSSSCYSLIIWVSTNKKDVCLFSQPAIINAFLTSSRQLFILYPLTTSI